MVKTTRKKKMMKLPSLFKSDDKSSWPWPSCRQPRTLSFRITSNIIPTPTAAATPTDSGGGDPLEAMIRGLRSAERLLVEPAGKSSSILKEEEVNDGVLEAALKEGTRVISLESKDPYRDFRKSMEEMVEAHGLKEWENLEELLSWYLRVNKKGNHGFILGAFVDLLVSLAMADSRFHNFKLMASSSSSCSSSSSFCSSSSSSCSFIPCASSSMEIIPSLQQHHHHPDHVFS